MDQIAQMCPSTLAPSPSSSAFLTLINTLMLSFCSLDPVNDYAKNYDVSQKLVFDFIVVGSGSAGSAVAGRLSDNPNNQVLLIEAGGYPTPATEVPGLIVNFETTQYDWNYPVIAPNACRGFKNGQCRWSMGKMLGGTGSINQMMYQPGFKNDFDDWAQAGNVGWDWENVTYYYKKAEEKSKPTVYHSTRKIRDALLAATVENNQQFYTTAEPLGYHETPISTVNGRRSSSAKTYIASAKDRKNLHILTDTFVTDLIMTTKNGKQIVVGVNARMKDGVIRKFSTRKEVILSAGIVNTPQILLKSGIGPQNRIKNLGIQTKVNLPVGLNLQDQLTLDAVFVSLNDGIQDPPRDFNDILYEYYTKFTGPFSNIDLTNFVGYINTKGDSPYPDVLIFHVFYTKGSTADLKLFFNAIHMNEETSEKIIELNKEKNLLLFYPTLIKPKSRGEVYIQSLQGQPIIEANYLKNPEDMNTMLKAVDYVREFLKTPTLQALDAKFVVHDDLCKDDTSPDGIDWKCYIQSFSSTVYDSAGSCKMGPKNDGTSVVDSQLRVHGVAGLRVVDCSIMPTITSGTTNAPAVMIGEKAADMILQQYAV